MDKKTERLLSITKGKVKERPTFGTDPNDPWSVKSNVTESKELDAYLKSTGINVATAGNISNISASKMNKFRQWKKNRKFVEDVENISEDEYLDAYLRSRGINPKTASKISKIAASKTGNFNAWKQHKLRGGRLPDLRHEQTTWMSSPKGTQNESIDKKDTVTMDIPLLIRMLELAREDVKSDAQLHKIVEKLIEIRNKGILTMDDYDFVSKLKEEFFPEDVYQDTYAATQTVGPEMTNSDDTEKNQNESKSAKLVKSLKKKTVREDMYDWEKDNKSIATYGKKPKIDVSPINPKAAGIIYGGKTLTGQSRDTIELDPMMKKPNVQPDFAKKANLSKK